MAISIIEFKTAMEIYGANRLPDAIGSRYNIAVPCFEIDGIFFKHSGSYYVVQSGEKKVPNEIMERAIEECRELYSKEINYWFGGIHTVAGMLTLATMIDGKYSQPLVGNLINETYKKLMGDVKTHISEKNFSFSDNGMEKLYEELTRLKKVINPFDQTSEYVLKDPVDLLNVGLGISYRNSRPGDVDLEITGKHCTTNYYLSYPGAWYYNTTFRVQRHRKAGYVMIHYYYVKSIQEPDKPVIYLSYLEEGHAKAYNLSNNIDLRIGLSTGLAWRTYKEADATPATEEQIRVMKMFIRMAIKKINKKIISNMCN